MKVVLDTNVIVAAFAARGLSHSLFELCLNRHTIVGSPYILQELEMSLKKKIKLPLQRINEILDYLKGSCLIEELKPLEKPVCRDAADDPILALALSSHADAIVTGDEDLLVLKKFRSIPILTPRQFWEKNRFPDNFK